MVPPLLRRPSYGLAEHVDSMVTASGSAPAESWSSWIASAPQHMAVFFKERVWLDSLLWARSCISVLRGAHPTLVRSRVEEVQRYHALIESSGTSRDQREALLNSFNRIRPDTKDLFQRIDSAMLNDYVNATSADVIAHTKTRLLRECSSFMSAQNSLMGISAFIALVSGNGSGNVPPINLTGPTPPAPPTPPPAPHASDAIALDQIGPHEKTRAKEIEILAKILPNGHAVKDGYDCPVGAVEMSSPVFDIHERRHVFQESNIHRIATTDTYSSRPLCPTCRTRVTVGNLRLDLTLQKEIQRKMAEAVSACQMLRFGTVFLWQLLSFAWASSPIACSSKDQAAAIAATSPRECCSGWESKRDPRAHHHYF